MISVCIPTRGERNKMLVELVKLLQEIDLNKEFKIKIYWEKTNEKPNLEGV
jgi:hypothetical protein